MTSGLAHLLLISPLMKSVAIYARISQDRDGERLGVTRQLEDCRAEAAKRGWTVAAEYVDDDVSAFKGARRPAYERMLGDIVSGARDAVIVWHLDRLHRQPIELEGFKQACDSVGLGTLVTLHGDVQLDSGDGMFLARIMAAMASNESAAKSRRGKRQILQRAQAGRPHGGGNRPYGYEADRVTVIPDEARVMANLAERTLAGQSLTSLCRWLADNQVPTVMGKEWRTPTLRGLLLNPRYAGLRALNGEVVGPATWPAIITTTQHERLVTLLTDPTRRTNRTARSYLLSGMCRCSKCGTKLYSQSDPEHGRRYLCKSGPDFGGCGKTSITATPVELMVVDLVLYRLDTPELAQALTAQAPDPEQATRLRDQIDADTQRLDELMVMYTDGKLSAQLLQPATQRLEARREANRRELTRLANSTDIDGLIGQGTALRAQWPTLNLDRQRAIVRTILSHVTILPAIPGVRTVSPDRLDPFWRL